MVGESGFDDSFFVSGASDLMGGDFVFDDSESGLLSDVVFAVVESVLVRGSFDLLGGESVSNDPGLISVASDFTEAKSVSDDSKSRLLNVVFVPVLVDAFVVLGASGLMGDDCISDESESGMVSVVVFAIVEALAGLGVT